MRPTMPAGVVYLPRFVSGSSGEDFPGIADWVVDHARPADQKINRGMRMPAYPRGRLIGANDVLEVRAEGRGERAVAKVGVMAT